MSERSVVIIGGKGSAINVAEQIENARSKYGYPMKVLGYANDDSSLGPYIAGLPIVSGLKDAWDRYRSDAVDFIFALYRPDVMAERFALLQQLGVPRERFANFVHPTAYVSPSVEMGFGNVIMSNATLQHGVSLGCFNIVNSNVVVEHESTVADGSFFAASACIGARVSIGCSVFIGLNATVREDVQVSDRAFIGMGSCVLRSVEADSTVYGVPARGGK